MKKRLQATGLAAALALAFAAPVWATTINAGLTAGVLNTIEDQDREAYIDSSASGAPDGVLGVGDVFVGFVRLDNFLPSGLPGGNTVYGVISNQIIAVNPLDPTIFSLGTTTHVGLDLATLTGNANCAGAMYCIYDGIAPVDYIAAPPSATANIFDYINAITGAGTLRVATGIVSLDNYLMVDNTAAFPAGSPNAAFPFLAASRTTGGFSGGLDVLYNATNFTFTDTVVTTDALGFDHTTPVGVGNGSVRGARGDGNESHFGNAPGFPQCSVAGVNTPCGFDTKADFFVAPVVVPEPGSLALIGAALLAFVGLRRKGMKG